MLMKIVRRLIIILIIFSFPVGVLCENQGSWYVYSQLKFPGNWDPYPDAFQQIYYYLLNTTSLRIKTDRRVVTLDDKELFYSPFLVLIGRGSYPEFTDEQIISLRRYLNGGGILLIDTCGDKDFSICADRTMARAFPMKRYKKLPQDNVLYKSFYLVDYISGRRIRLPYLEGIKINSKIAVIKSQNDLIAIWPRDQFGNWKNKLIPDKYGQRKEAIKLTLNILMYSVCGTYKSDPVHQPFIKKKLGR